MMITVHLAQHNSRLGEEANFHLQQLTVMVLGLHTTLTLSCVGTSKLGTIQTGFPCRCDLWFSRSGQHLLLQGSLHLMQRAKMVQWLAVWVLTALSWEMQLGCAGIGCQS